MASILAQLFRTLSPLMLALLVPFTVSLLLTDLLLTDVMAAEASPRTNTSTLLSDPPSGKSHTGANVGSLTGNMARSTSKSTSNGASKATQSIDLDARWFQVELILFSQHIETALDAEQWPEIEGLILPTPLLELSLAPAGFEDNNASNASNANNDVAPDAKPSTGTLADDKETPDLPIPYQFLSADTLQLTDMAKKIRRSSKQALLLHISWQQPTYDREQAVPIYFEAGMDKHLPLEVALDAEINNRTDKEARTFSTLNNEPKQQTTGVYLNEYTTNTHTMTGPQSPQFAGTVTLSVERYLHLAADLVYRSPVTQHAPIPIPDLELWYDRPYPTLQEPQGPAFQQMEWQAIRGFRLKESRRMRSTVVHYLDHPFMGLVVIITPIELPEPEEEVLTDTPIRLSDM